MYSLLIALESVTQNNCSDGEVRLTGGATDYEGRVEVCVNQAWGTICAYSGWSSTTAKIVCTQIGALPRGIIVSLQSDNYYVFVIIIIAGYSQGRVGTLGFLKGSGAVILGYLSCTGEENSLVDCNQNYYLTNTDSHCQTHYYDAAVKCERKLVLSKIMIVLL